MEIASREVEFNIWSYEVEGWLEQRSKGGSLVVAVGPVRAYAYHCLPIGWDPLEPGKVRDGRGDVHDFDSG